MENRIDPNKAPRASLYPHPYSNLHPELARFIRSLPKAENHVHAEGVLNIFLLQRKPLEMFNGFYGTTSPFEIPGLGYRKFEQFDEFSDQFLEIARSWFNTPEAYGEASGAYLADCWRQNILSVELSIDLRTASWEGIKGGMPAVLKAIRKEAKEIAPEIDLKLVATMRRKDHPAYAEEMEELLTCPDLDGFDISGSERAPFQDWTIQFYDRARKAGKFTKAHVGEFESGEEVWRAVQQLGIQRVQHGGTVADHPELFEELRERKVGFDMCPISNDSLEAQNLQTTPILKMLRAGLLVGVHSDDPMYFGDNTDQYVAMAMAGASQQELVQLARNSLLVCHMSEEAKEPLLQELAAIEKSLDVKERTQGRQRLDSLKETDFGSRSPKPDKGPEPDRQAFQAPGTR